MADALKPFFNAALVRRLAGGIALPAPPGGDEPASAHASAMSRWCPSPRNPARIVPYGRKDVE